jgi:hypothetical protein
MNIVAWRYRPTMGVDKFQWRLTEVPPWKWGTDLAIEQQPLYAKSPQDGTNSAEVIAGLEMALAQAAAMIERQQHVMQRAMDAPDAAVAEAHKQWSDAITPEMPADFKDWHDTSAPARPEIAAWSIRNLRERLREAAAEMERLRTENAALKHDLQYARDGLIRGHTRMREDNERLRAALAELLACHTESAGWSMSMLTDRAEFDAMLARSQERLHAAIGAAREALGHNA